ncbi:MAG: hypothetical protein IBX41_03140 [Methanophagales archaeon]|nr:hypothetical protein [Methanophagales archaeon]
MKWLNKIRGKEEIPSTVSFDGIDTWLEMVSNALFRGLNTNAARLYDEIEAIRERLKQDISELQNAESTEEVPDRIEKIGLLSRDKMVKHLYSVAEKIVIPAQTDYKTVWSFYQETTSSLEFPFGKSQTNIYCVRSLFPSEIKEVISDLNRLRTALDQLIAPLKEKESQIEHLEQVPEFIEAIRELRSAVEKEKEKINDQEGDCSALERRIELEDKRLKLIEEKEEWKQYKAHETELSSLETDLNELESDVRRMFTPLTKALNLLKKQDETGRHTLTPEERNAIAAILASPIDALNDDVNANLLVIKNIIEGDPAVLKDRKREQTLNWLDHLLNTDLVSMKGRREQLQSQIEEVKGTLSDLRILKEKEELEHSLVSAQGQLKQLQEGIDRSKGHIGSLEEDLEEKKRLLLETLEGIAGKKIDLQITLV